MASALFSGIVVVGALFAPACFDPRYNHSACGPNDACPSGQRCNPQGFCEADGGGVDGGGVDGAKKILPPGLAGRWMLADGTGTTASDVLGAHPATLNGGVTWSQDSDHGVTAAFDGSTGYLATSVPVITTNASYTVSAWVKLADKSAQHTILSQDGVHHSPFYLQYDNTNDEWRLYISSGDLSDPVWYKAGSTTIPPQIGVWIHLVGVYDSTAKTVKLYINGQAQGSMGNVATWSSTSVTWIGRSKSTWWRGNLSYVQIYFRALSAAEATGL